MNNLVRYTLEGGLLSKNNYYVYAHLRKDNKHPFYIGKGRRDRAFGARNQRTKEWINIYRNHGCEVRFIAQNLDEELALLCESEAIDAYEKIGYTLVNVHKK